MVWPGQLTKEEEQSTGFLFWVRLVLPYAWFTLRAGPPPKITPTRTTINTETCRREHTKTNNECCDARAKLQNTTTHIQKYSKQVQLKIQTHSTNNKRNPMAPEHTNRGRTFGPNTRRFSLARGPVCANTTRSELRDKTMFGRSKWWRMLVFF